MAASMIVQLPAATLELPGEIRQLLEGSPTSPAPTVDIHETIVVPDHSTTDTHPVIQQVDSGSAGGNGSKPYTGTPGWARPVITAEVTYLERTPWDCSASPSGAA
jgi:hypothetical protein